MLRRWFACSLIGLAGTLVACSGGTSGTTPDTTVSGALPTVPDTAPDETSPPVVGTDPDSPAVTNPTTGADGALADRLLGAADVGEGWTVIDAPADADFGSLGDSTCDGQAVEPAVVERVRAQAGVVLQSPKPFGVTVSQSILEAPAEQLEADLAAVFRVDAACAAKDIALNDSTIARAEIIELGQVGDQQQAARLSILVGSEVVSSGYIAIVRIGRYAFELSLTEETGSAPADSMLEPADFEELLRVALEKLSA